MVMEKVLAWCWPGAAGLPQGTRHHTACVQATHRLRSANGAVGPMCILFRLPGWIRLLPYSRKGSGFQNGCILSRSKPFTGESFGRSIHFRCFKSGI